MTAPHDPPSAIELVQAVREFLEKDVMQATDGRVQFHTRVAINVLAILERELALGPAQERTHAERLRELGFEDEGGLAAAIKDRTVSAADVIDAVRATVRAKLDVANPTYAGEETPGYKVSGDDSG